jgi:hypothetical protein
MARSKHILPFLLEGAVQEIDSASSNQAWNQLTSFVNIGNTANINFTVGEPSQKVPGALLSIIKENSNAADITVKLSTLALDDEFDDIVLGEQDNCVLLMWNGTKWVVLGQFLGGSFTGGSVTGATTFGSTVRFNGNVGFYNNAPVAQPANDADVTVDTDLPAADSASSSYTQSEINGIINTLRATVTLVNALNADLKTLNLKASSYFLLKETFFFGAADASSA